MRRARYNYRKYLRYLRREAKKWWSVYKTAALLRWIEEEAKKMQESERAKKPERARRAQVLEDWEDGFP